MELLCLRGVDKDNSNIRPFLKVLPIVMFHLLLIIFKHLKNSEIRINFNFSTFTL
jgi:hypothetical protein